MTTHRTTPLGHGPRLRRLIAPALALLGSVNATHIEGHIGNTNTVTSALGGQDVIVLLANFTEGRIIGMSSMASGGFSVTIPREFKPNLTPMNLCNGVKVSPSEPRTYTVEGLLVYNAKRNMVATLVQADRPNDPTRRTQWVYSDRKARIKGRCTGMNTRYNLTLRQGWNPVMTVSKSGDFLFTNATPGLPYWVQGNFMANARSAFNTIFDGR